MKALPLTELFALAKDHNVSTEKLNALIQYNAQLYVQQCDRAFRRAYAKLQAALPIIEQNATITFRDGRTGTYAPNDEIQEIVGPICRQFGFTLSFSTTYPAPVMVRVVGELAHKEGHSKTSEYEARVDSTGGKTDTQGRGSVVTYGHRYCTVDLLNLIQRGADSDGATGIPAAPMLLSEDVKVAFPNLCAAALHGVDALELAWRELVDRDAVPDADWTVLKAMAQLADETSAHAL